VEKRVRLTIDRSQATPVYQQIKGQIIYAIGTGVFQSGQRLPTIRQLAADLGVAPLTVVQAFEELQKEGLVEVRPGVGAFVVDLHPAMIERSRRAVMDEVVTRGIEEANNRGVSAREYARALWDRVFPGAERGNPRALLIGNYEDDTTLLAAEVAEELGAERLKVDGCTVEALRDPSPSTLALIDDVDLVISVPMRFAEVRRLVGDRKLVFGMPIIVSPTTRERWAQLPDSMTVGLVARAASAMQSMRNVVAIYRPATASAPVASFDDEGGVIALLNGVDAVIYSMGVRDRIQPLLPRNVLALEMAHIPDPAAIGDLRQTLNEIANETGRTLAPAQAAMAVAGAVPVTDTGGEGGIRA
jgi:DNA-binding transcriptional regulator YhcF (GntR family)